MNIIIKKPDDEAGLRLYNQICKILLVAGVKKVDLDYCLIWAFGSDIFTAPVGEWPLRWNKKHPTAFKATGKDKFVQFIFTIGFYYCTQKERTKHKT